MYCGHSSAFNFDRIFFILDSNKDNHNILDEFEFEPDLTSDCALAALKCLKKSIFCVVATLASLFFSRSSSFLEVIRITITSLMSSNLSQIRP